MRKRFKAYGMLIACAVVSSGLTGCSYIEENLAAGMKYSAIVSHADELRSQGRFQLAIDEYDKAIRLCPKLGEAYSGRGLAYGGLGQKQKMMVDCNKAVSVMKGSGLSSEKDTYLARGFAYDILGETQKAIDDCSTAIKLAPEDAEESYLQRAGDYVKLKEYPKAIDDLSTVIKLKPKEYNAYQSRAGVYLMMGEKQKAFEDLDKLIELDPKAPVAYYVRGNTFAELGLYQNAIDDYSKTIDLLRPKINGAVYYKRAELYEKLGKNALAEKDREMVKESGYKPVSAKK